VGKISKKKILKSVLCLFLLLTCIIACAKFTSKVQQVAPEDYLKERVTAYITHRIKGEFDKSYGYEDPLYRKKINEATYINFMSKGIFNWVEANIKKISIEGETAVVQIDLQGWARLKGISNEKNLIEQTIQLNWVKAEGTWYNSLTLN
jgi:hypothetical protein